MNCPECGRFMTLEHVDPAPTLDEDGAAFAWFCGNEDCDRNWRGDGIGDHTYDWEAWGIDDAEMERLKTEWPECYEEFKAMEKGYRERSKPRRRKRVRR